MTTDSGLPAQVPIWQRSFLPEDRPLALPPPAMPTTAAPPRRAAAAPPCPLRDPSDCPRRLPAASHRVRARRPGVRRPGVPVDPYRPSP